MYWPGTGTDVIRCLHSVPMTTPPPPTTGLIAVYRTLPARLVGWSIAGATLVGGFLTVRAEAAIGGSVLVPLAVSVAIIAVAWVLLLRPLVELHGDRVVQRNLLRDVEVPFGRLAEVRHDWALELVDTAGRTHSSWAVPKQREFSARRASDDFAETTARRRARPGTTAIVVADDVQRAWQRWRLAGGVAEDGAPAHHRWAWSALLPLATSLVCLVLALLLS